jgi:hypothetical protein
MFAGLLWLDLNENEQVTFLHKLKEIGGTGRDKVTSDAAYNLAKAMTNRKV